MRVIDRGQSRTDPTTRKRGKVEPRLNGAPPIRSPCKSGRIRTHACA